MSHGQRQALVAAIVEADEAGREVREFLHLQLARERIEAADEYVETYEPWFVKGVRRVGLGRFVKLASSPTSRSVARSHERTHIRPSAVNASKAVTAARRYAAALDDLAGAVDDSELREAANRATTWPDRLAAADRNFADVDGEIAAAQQLIDPYKQRADLGRPIIERQTLDAIEGPTDDRPVLP